MFTRTLKQIFSRGASILINQISVLISLPLLASKLDIYVFGQVAIGFVIVQLSWVVSDWGIQHYSIEKWTEKKTKKEQNFFTSLVIYMNGFIAAICSALLLLISSLSIIDFPVHFAIALIPSILMGGIFPLWFFQVNKCPNEIIIPTFFSRIIFLSIIYFLVIDNNSAYWAFLAQGLNLTLITFYSFFKIFTKHQISLVKIKIVDLFVILKTSSFFLLNAITNNQISTLWGFGLSIVGGPSAMAIFNLGEQVYRAGGVMTNIIAQSIRINFINNSLKDLKFIIIFFISIFVTITIIILNYTDFAVNTFFSNNYSSSIIVIKVMTVAWCINAITKIINFPILGLLAGYNFVNKLNFKILIAHILIFFLWFYFFVSTISMCTLFCGVIFFQLITFLVFSYKYSR